MSSLHALIDLFVLVTGLLFAIMPDLSRPGILFGVTVAPDFRTADNGRRLVRNYRRSIAIFTFSILAISFVLPSMESLMPLSVGFAGLTGIACWIQASRRTRPFAQSSSSIRVASLIPQPRTLPGGLLFVLGPYLILGLAGWFLYANWASIPEVFPIRWSANGTPIGWAQRTATGVFGLLLLGLPGVTVTIAVACAVFYTARNGSGTAVLDVSLKRPTFFIMLLVSYFISMMLAVMATRPVWSSDANRSPSPMIFVFTFGVMFVVAIGAVVYLARVARARSGSGDGTPDERWKWGLFYYNPDDASLFVEKRMGLGYTLNFANKLAWMFLAIPLLPAILIFVVARLTK